MGTCQALFQPVAAARYNDPMVDAYLVEVARALDGDMDRVRIHEALDRLEFLYDALDELQQELADGLMQRLRARLEDTR